MTGQVPFGSYAHLVKPLPLAVELQPCLTTRNHRSVRAPASNSLIFLSVIRATLHARRSVSLPRAKPA